MTTRSFCEHYAAEPSLAVLLEAVNQQIANAMVVGLLDLGLREERLADLRFLQGVLAQMAERLDGSITYRSPWATALSIGRLDDPDAGVLLLAEPEAPASCSWPRAARKAISRTTASGSRAFAPP